MKKWVVHPKKSNNIIDQLLINRKINLKNKERFLNPNYERDMYNPFLFHDMDKAVKRIIQAIANKEKIGIFADYDADGIPGAAIISRVLRYIGVEVSVYIPTREEGYGLNEAGILELKESGCKLIITVDLGITGKEQVKFAKSLGIDVIVTDHHLFKKTQLPSDALAIIHPQLSPKYPNKDLAGGAVAWKLAQGLLLAIAHHSQKDVHSTRAPQGLRVALATHFLRHDSQSYDKQYAIGDKLMRWLLDLAAISTITDIVPLTGENRVIAKYGLFVLAKTKNIGLQELIKVAAIKPEKMSTYEVGFRIGPRINAPGRLDHAQISYYLLTTNSRSEAKEYASKLNKINLKRQEELDRVLKEAKAKIEKRGLKNKKIILVEDENWPEGLIGLVAGKLMEELSRPVIVFKEDKGRLKGSARSIEKFHILEALDNSAKLLIKHGGHARAAGLSLEKENLQNLYDQLIQLVNTKLSEDDLQPKIKIDVEIKPENITMDFYNQLQKFEPHGMGNPRPVFLMKDIIINNIRTVGKDSKHLKLVLHATRYTLHDFDAIGFDLGYLDKELKINDTVDIVFTLDLNEFNGNKKLQLKLLDIREG